jgi:predicted GNAT family N-acyltransferase
MESTTNPAMPFEVRRADWRMHGATLSAIRRDVFVVEQHVPESEEWDEWDAVSRHVIALADGAGVAPEGCCRTGESAAWQC